MNVSELERLLEKGQDWDNVEGEIARLELASKWEYLTRRVIAAERLVEALNRIKYQNVHPDVFPRMAAEALTAYEATKWRIE